MPSGATQSTLHKALVKDVAKYVKSRGGWVFKVYGGAFGATGCPDFFCGLPIERFPNLPAVLLGLECKTGAATLNPSQLKVKAEMEKARIVYIVVHDVVGLEEALLAARLITTRTLQRKLIEEVG